ncbi:hypothetical protein [Dysgonomonas sp. 511]|uniref:hypothetical protein n=1 Tax=Dysgonomonas sp. 511 TaxID=2302930 RepID=UPI0013D3E92A|nr:hypothetical protein [Dysgonomonas sp. 511]NDV78140.1 hypothetical protein [Dysgonomonas sp. 511]
MKIIYSKHFPPKGFGAINLFGLIIARKEYGRLTSVEKDHELIHTRQMLEMLIIPFYLSYVAEWLIRWIQYGDKYKAYLNISYEREAYRNMHDPSYLKKRKLYSFIHYYRKEAET